MVYKNTTVPHHMTKTYGMSFMQVMRERSRKWTNLIPETVKTWEGKEHWLWIAPVHFCAMQYIIDGHYLGREAAPELERV